MNSAVIKKLKEILGDKNVLSDAAQLESYCHDEMTESQRKRPSRPFITVRPEDTGQVSDILKLAGKEGIPVTARGAGTGLCGGCVPVSGGIVLSLEKMDKVLELDSDNLMMSLQAGVPLTRIYEKLEGTDFFFPPHPGDEGAHIGGLAATNAGGSRAVKYGTIRNYIKGLEVVLADGRIINPGGKLVKSSTGFNLLGLFVGSEGTLGIITKVIISLLPRPKTSATLIAPFEKLEDAIKAVPVIIAEGISPVAIEFMEDDIIELAEKKFNKKWPAPKAASYLMFILDADNGDVLEEAAGSLADVCQKNGALDVFIADKAAKQKEVLQFRSNFHEALKPDMIEDLDLVVPRSKIAELVDFIHGLEKKHKAHLLTYGHAGDGNVHVHVMKSQLSAISYQLSVKKELYKKTKELGGTLTGEHGIGLIKTDELPEFVGKAQIDLMKAVKKAFDPKGILNPGKIIK